MNWSRNRILGLLIAQLRFSLSGLLFLRGLGCGGHLVGIVLGCLGVFLWLHAGLYRSLCRERMFYNVCTSILAAEEVSRMHLRRVKGEDVDLLPSISNIQP